MFEFIESQIRARRSAMSEDGPKAKRAFNLIVNANEESSKMKLTDREVVGNTFAIFVGGYGESLQLE